MLLKVITAIKKPINRLKMKYMRYVKMIYNIYLYITRFVLLIAKTQLEHVFNRLLY